ncbi:MAG: hypothetical protein H5T63_02885, partial [Chloroflexi bacterium]|nr:hypothetical protein [Chloroflexota bacterium]
MAFDKQAVLMYSNANFKMFWQSMDEIKERLLHLIPRLAGHNVLVIGDLFLDEYVLGQATRLSREAPIPVLEFLRRFYVPGGAANPAHNICALGGHAAVVGLIGGDSAGVQLVSELRQVGIDPSGVVVDNSRPTTTKTRILAEGSLRFPQQVARIDHVDRRSVSQEIEAALIAQIQAIAPKVEAILVSDYQTGVASQAVVQAAQRIAHAQGKLCTVDAQGAFHKYAGFHLIKGNRHEVKSALGCSLQREEDYHQAGKELLRQLDAEAVIITR